MASPDSKPPPSPRMGFVMPPGNQDPHGYVNPMTGGGAPYPPNPMSGGGAPYPPNPMSGGGAPYPPNPMSGGGAPYPPNPMSGGGAPYPPNPAFQPAMPASPPNPYPYSPPSGNYPPPSGNPYSPGGPYPPSNNPSYPGSPGFNSSGEPLVGGPYGQVYPPQPGAPMGDYVPKDDPEDPFSGGDENKVFDFSDKTIRRQFIKKVYAILMFQLLITFGFVALCLFHKGVQRGVQRNPALVYVAIGITFVTLIPMVCCKSARRTFPMNFIFLTVFTLAQGFTLGVVTTAYEVDSVLIAIGITTVVCLSLTLFAFQTKYDFTAMGGVLLVCLIVLLLMGLVAMFFPGNTMRVVYGSAGALVFSLYLIYDTQLMMGGQHKASISPEEYIFAALNIYLDVINLFMYILMIMGNKK